MDWKSIGEKVVVAVIAGLILGVLGWFGAQIMAPDAQTVFANLTWIDIPNAAFRMDKKAASDLDRQIQNSFGLSGAPQFLSALGYEPTARIGTITFQNTAATRSKEIEVSFKSGALFSNSATEQTGVTRSSLKLKPLEPNGTTTVTFIAEPWLYFQNPPVTSIHDDREVEVLSIGGNPEYEGFVAWTEKYAILVFVIFSVGGFTILILLGSILLYFIVPDPIKWRAKLIDAKQVKKEIEFIEYIKAHYPEKLPKSN